MPDRIDFRVNRPKAGVDATQRSGIRDDIWYIYGKIAEILIFSPEKEIRKLMAIANSKDSSDQELFVESEKLEKLLAKKHPRNRNGLPILDFESGRDAIIRGKKFPFS